MTIWSSGYKVRSISKLDEETALSRGADLLSEAIVFSVAAGVTTYEYLRSSEKSQKKEEAQLQKIRDDAAKLQAKLNSLDKRLVALEEYAKANRSSISLIRGGKEYVEPEAGVPIDDAKGEDEKKSTKPLQPLNATKVKNETSWWPF